MSYRLVTLSDTCPVCDEPLQAFEQTWPDRPPERQPERQHLPCARCGDGPALRNLLLAERPSLAYPPPEGARPGAAPVVTAWRWRRPDASAPGGFVYRWEFEEPKP